MAASLREDIRKYERENNTKFTCVALGLRCLNCPISALGCGLARRRLASDVMRE